VVEQQLDKLYVEASWQRHGIGGQLIAELARRARNHGVTRLVLRVNRQNQTAIDAYLKHGFTVATVVLEDIGDGFVMDDYVMVKEI
jgi:GNAT superfamily N-acetyltransferase